MPCHHAVQNHSKSSVFTLLERVYLVQPSVLGPMTVVLTRGFSGTFFAEVLLVRRHLGACARALLLGIVPQDDI
jgi:hypothetical protein